MLNNETFESDSKRGVGARILLIKMNVAVL